MTFRIYTKTGDEGETSLFGGERVPKHHTRVEAYGTVDELNSVLGLARALDVPEHLDTIVSTVQSQLFELGAELASPTTQPQGHEGLGDQDVAALEQHIDTIEASLEPLKSFILPGGSAAAAQLHFARSVCRRAERCCTALEQAGANLRPLVLTYLNRLSDLLFVMARSANAAAGVAETKWHARR